MKQNDSTQNMPLYDEMSSMQAPSTLSILRPLAKKAFAHYPKTCLSILSIFLIALISMVYFLFSVPYETSRMLISRIANSISIKADPRMRFSSIWKNIPYITKRANLFKNAIYQLAKESSDSSD
jgi:hypothetical protein